jgi:mannose-6-phosphate isomerase-like protein (cupin superfamily)
MKAQFASFAVLLAVSCLMAQDKTITVWPKGVPPGGFSQKANFGDHILSISHRDKSGRVEIHERKADVLVIQSGSATFVCGGTIVNPVHVAPGEVQGSEIRGGTGRTVGPGDVIEVPAGLPHQFLLAPGSQITYLVIKIVKPH